MLDRPLNPLLLRDQDAPIGWARSDGLVDYEAAVASMEARVAAIAAGEAEELIWLLEHPPLYTAGVSAKPADLVQPDRFPVHQTGRGGQYTYHGPGQRVAYVMLDLGKRGRDVRAFVAGLENWVIDALESLGVESGPREGRIGVWVDLGSGHEGKIAALGIKLRRWISFHGISLNVSPDLGHFGGIVPCGIADQGVTSLEQLGVDAGMDRADAALRTAFERRFGPTRVAEPPI